MNNDGSLSLRAVTNDFGDNASVTEFKLCAVGADVPLADVGYGNSPVELMALPDEGKVLTVADQAQVPKHFVTIDDSKTVLAADVGGNTLERILPKGSCTDLTVTTLTGVSRHAMVGFSHTLTPSGEWRPQGGFSYLDELQTEPGSIRYEAT